MRKYTIRLYQHKYGNVVRGYRINPNFFASNVEGSIVGWYISLNLENKIKLIEEGFWSFNNNDEKLHCIVEDKLVTSYDYYL